MTMAEEFVLVLLMFYLLSVVWLVLDVLFGHSKGAAKLRAVGLATWELVAMSVFWPVLLVGPWAAVAVLATASALRTARAVMIVTWEEISGRE